MRNKYNHQHLQQEQREQQQRSTTSTLFLPMLCSSSTKQVKISHRRCSSTSSSVTDEPSSPKVGCMGQVKRNNKVVGFPNIISFTSTTTTTSSSTAHHALKCHDQTNYSSNSIVKYHKLKRFFSSKTLTGSPTSVIATARTTAAGPPKGKHRRNNSGSAVNVNNRGRATGGDHYHGMVCRSKVDENVSKTNKDNVDKSCLVNLVELDPPLPVVKKPVAQRQQEGNDVENASTLWKRRSGGVALKSLQVQVIHQSPSLLPVNTV